MKHSLAATIAVTLGAFTGNAFADACSGRDYTGGTIAGGVLGGVLGGLFTRGNGVGIIGGALLGELAGNAISRDMDCEDRPHAAARSTVTASTARLGGAINGAAAATMATSSPTANITGGPRLCRDFTQVVYRRGQEFDRDGTACQRRDGGWEFL